MQTQHDADFGPMTYNGYWILERPAIIGDLSVSIEIDPENQETLEISALQREAVRYALSLPTDTLQKSALQVVQNYEVYREMLGDEEVPPLETPDDVWKKVQIHNIYVPQHFEATKATFFLLAECEWDIEHGLYLRFRDGVLDDVDQQNDFPLED